MKGFFEFLSQLNCRVNPMHIPEAAGPCHQPDIYWRQQDIVRLPAALAAHRALELKVVRIVYEVVMRQQVFNFAGVCPAVRFR